MAILVTATWVLSASPASFAQKDEGSVISDDTNPSGKAEKAGFFKKSVKSVEDKAAVEKVPVKKPSGEETLATEETAKVGDQEEGIAQQKEEIVVEVPPYFGYDFFIPAKKSILELEKRIANGEVSLPNMEERSALSGFVGPLEMITSSIYATVSHRYVLAPGDLITLSYWSKMQELAQASLTVDERGSINIPGKVGKMVVRGMTLNQLQGNLRKAMRRVAYKDMEVIVSLDELRSIRVFITGETFRPGSYAVSAVTTLFNALYVSGGPSDIGSLRDIRLIRNQKTIRVDFYDYLLRGDASNDIPLQAGDTIFIPPVRKIVEIRGELLRPGMYELKNGEKLTELVEIAGGAKTSALLDKILLESIRPNREKIVVEVDLSKSEPSPNPNLYDGDVVTVQAILPTIQNMVELEGAVERPGIYELKKGMKVADLFSDVNRPLADFYETRADVVRLNPDLKTTTLIPINLGKALENQPEHNIALANRDKVLVYSEWDVRYIPPRVVKIFGAVQRPGQYIRSDNMKLRDLFLAAGGPQPGYYEIMEVARARRTGKVEIIKIDLDAFMKGEETLNIILEDEDVVMVKTKTEFFDKPLYVTISGEVKYPGTYALRTRKDRISDLIKRAGGYTELAYPKGAVFMRKMGNIQFEEQQADLDILNKIVNVTNELEYGRQVAKNNYLSAKEQQGMAKSAINIPTVYGGGSAAEAAAVGMTPLLSDSVGQTVGKVFDVGGQLPSTVSMARQFGEEELQPSERIIVNMSNAVESPGRDNDLILMEGDSIEVRQKPATVSVIGGVMRPTLISYEHKQKKVGLFRKVVASASPEYYIAMAGGYTEDSNPERVVILRVDGSIIPLEELGAVEEGDIIYVPPKVMATEIVERIDKIIEVIKFTLMTASTVMIFVTLLGAL